MLAFKRYFKAGRTTPALGTPTHDSASSQMMTMLVCLALFTLMCLCFIA